MNTISIKIMISRIKKNRSIIKMDLSISSVFLQLYWAEWVNRFSGYPKVNTSQIVRQNRQNVFSLVSFGLSIMQPKFSVQYLLH